VGPLDVWKNRDTFIFKGKEVEEYWAVPLSLEEEEKRSFETSVTTHTTSQRHIPKDLTPHQHR
jgi:hypothetical protein